MSIVRKQSGGHVAPADLGSYPTSTKFLRGDGTWQEVSGGGGETGNVDGGSPTSIYGGSVTIDGGSP